MTRRFWVGVAFLISILAQACHPVYAQDTNAVADQAKTAVSARP